MGTAGIFLSHTWSPRIELHFDRLVRECGSTIEWHVVRGRVDAPRHDPSWASGETILPWRFEQMRRNGGVQGGFMDTVIWPRLLLLDADFTWIMEYDVDFAGDWASFFKQFGANFADLLTTGIVPRRDVDDWYWWKSATAPPDVDPQQMHRAFLPVMRVSERFAHAYPKAMQDPRWGGHYEFTIPTAAIVDGFVVEDIGGNGPFCPNARRSRNYTAGTFAWRPSREFYFVEAPDSFPEPHLLYHPVKGGVPEWDTESDLGSTATTTSTPTMPAEAVASTKQGNSATISVAMATYNGERYLREQLESLRRQDLVPDELIICDDGSTDATVRLASEFALNAPFSVEVVRNRKNLGYSRNFMAAVERCRGDLIFFCDQDDVWSPQKISTISRTAAATPEQVISHDIAVFSDDASKPSFPSYFEYLGRSGFPPAICIKGCATAVKTEFLRKWGWPRADADVSYDFWIALLATAFRQRRYVAHPLVEHRLHADNTSGWIASDAAGGGSISAVRRHRQSDTDLLVELCITGWNLHWKDEFIRVLREHCIDCSREDAAGLLRSLGKKRNYCSWLPSWLKQYSFS